MRAVEDHHVDRPGVEAWQHVKLTGTNRSIGLITPARQAFGPWGPGGLTRLCAFTRRGKHQAATLRWPEIQKDRDRRKDGQDLAASASADLAAADGKAARFMRRVWTTWWLWRGGHTRSHPELGREDPQRRWYCILRCGRVGRCQVFQARRKTCRPVPMIFSGRFRPPAAGRSPGFALRTQEPWC